MKEKRLIAYAITAMRRTIVQTLLLTSLVCTASAKFSNAQILDKIVSVKLKNGEIRKLISLVQKQTGIKFIFSVDLIKAERKVSCDIQSRKLSYFLDEILKPLAIGYKIFDDQILLVPLPAPDKAVDKSITEGIDTTQKSDPGPILRGRVVSPDGQPLQGASVKVEGLSKGTTTDPNGDFRLTMTGKEKILIISFTGYVTTKVTIGSQASLIITLPVSDARLNDVVVVGYGRQKKITLTGAISTVSGKELMQSPAASLQNNMMGKLTGFTTLQKTGVPGGDGGDFYIRGVSTYNTGASSPLIVVDDIQTDYTQFSLINPSEIESITVLKDASTTSLYGIKGANGVVVVTTRRGKAGKPSVTLNTQFGLQQPTILPTFLNSYQVASLYDQAQINDNAYSSSPISNFQPKFSDQDLQLYQSGADPYGHPNVNWEKVLFKQFSLQERSNIDISGGTDKARYFVSVGHLYQNGMLRNFSKGQHANTDWFDQRYNYRSNLDMTITSNLDLRVDLSGNINEVNSPNPGGAFNDVFTELSYWKQLAPYNYPVKNPNGTWGYTEMQRSFYGSGYNTNNVVGRLTLDGYNRTFSNNLNLNITPTLKLGFITQGLSLKGVVSYASSYSYSRSEQRAATFPAYIYNINTNTYIARDSTQLTVPRYGINYSGNSTVRVLTLQSSLNYDRTFSGAHHVSGLFLFNESSQTAQNSTVAYNFVPVNFRGITGRFGYEYKSKYLIQVSGAYNGTDRFVANKRFGLFPAISGGWNIAEESFVKDNISFLNLFKIRASYGLVGSDQLPSGSLYSYQQVYTQGNGIASYPGSFGTTDNPYTGVVEGTLANTNVTWEREKKFDIGTDYSLFNGKISGSVDYFNDNRYDILTTRGTVSAVFGVGLPPVNLGKVNNYGYEAEMTFQQKITRDLTITVKGMYSFAKNKIVFMDEPKQQFAYQAKTGKSIGAPLLYKSTGFYKSIQDIQSSPTPPGQAIPGDLKYADLNKDGVVNNFDEYISDKTNFPTTIYGLQLGAGYRRFNISVLFQAATGFNVSNGGAEIAPFFGNLQPIHLKAWTPQLGDAAKFPVLKTASASSISESTVNLSTFYYIPGDYLRLKNAEFSYSLPDKMVRRLRIQNARVFLNGNDLLTWTGMHRLYQTDPEIPASGAGITGSSILRYPPQRTYNMGLSITF